MTFVKPAKFWKKMKNISTSHISHMFMTILHCWPEYYHIDFLCLASHDCTQQGSGGGKPLWCTGQKHFGKSNNVTRPGRNFHYANLISHYFAKFTLHLLSEISVIMPYCGNILVLEPKNHHNLWLVFTTLVVFCVIFLSSKCTLLYKIDTRTHFALKYSANCWFFISIFFLKISNNYAKTNCENFLRTICNT